MRFSLDHIVRSELVRNSTRLLTANVVAQAIGLIVYPLLTRLYSPDDFGLLNLFLTIGGVLVLFSAGEYQNAIVLPKEDRKANALVHLSLIILIITTIIVIFSALFSKQIAFLFDAPALSKWYRLMPVYIISYGGWRIISYYYLRRKMFNRISGYQISQTLFTTGGKLGLGYAGATASGLIVSSVLAPLLSLVCSLLLAGKKQLRLLLHIDKAQIKQVASEYHKFPLYTLPQTLVNTVSSSLPTLLLTSAFGLTEMGFFAMAFTLAFRPLSMIVQSIYQVMFQRISEMVNNKQTIHQLLYKYTVRSFVVAGVAFAILYWILPALTSLLLGDQWQVTGEYIRYLLPWLLLMCVTGPIAFLPEIFGLQRPAFIIEIVYLSLRCLVLLAGIWIGDFRLTLIAYSLVSTMVISGQLVWFIRIIRRYEQALS